MGKYITYTVYRTLPVEERKGWGCDRVSALICAPAQLTEKEVLNKALTLEHFSGCKLDDLKITIQGSESGDED